MHPIAFHLGSLPIHSYGVMIALAFLAGLWTVTLRARHDPALRGSGDKIADITLWLMAGAIVGARIVYVTTYWKEEFAGQPLIEIFAIWNGGLVYYGGLIGAALAGFIYIRWKQMPLWKTADVFAPSIALGSVFGRIGCLLNGCCYGRACNLPWAISFPPDNPLHPPTYPVHPTEIYDALLNLGLYLFLAWLFRRKKFDGQVFATYLDLLLHHTLDCGILPGRLFKPPLSPRSHAGAMGECSHVHRGPAAGGAALAARELKRG